MLNITSHSTEFSFPCAYMLPPPPKQVSTTFKIRGIPEGTVRLKKQYDGRFAYGVIIYTSETSCAVLFYNTVKFRTLEVRWVLSRCYKTEVSRRWEAGSISPAEFRRHGVEMEPEQHEAVLVATKIS